jgi:hypothetical protein
MRRAPYFWGLLALPLAILGAGCSDEPGDPSILSLAPGCVRIAGDWTMTSQHSLSYCGEYHTHSGQLVVRQDGEAIWGTYTMVILDEEQVEDPVIMAFRGQANETGFVMFFPRERYIGAVRGSGLNTYIEGTYEGDDAQNCHWLGDFRCVRQSD